MPANDDGVIGSDITITVDGAEISAEVADLLIDVVVDQNVHLPHMFTIRLFDPTLALLDSGPFDLTKEVIIVAMDANDQRHTLITGEITAMEPAFQKGMVAELVVRGYDRSHRLFRETKSRAFLNIKDSDLASQFAGNAGLSTQIDATTTVYDHLYQDNQSDLAFLMQRAWRIGYECYVAGGKLVFRKPPAEGSTLTLTWGEDLISFAPRMTLAEQVDEVIVKGWDAESQRAIVGQASRGSLYPAIQESRNGQRWASSFGSGKLVVVDEPVVSQAEANVLAAARLNEISGLFVDAEGTAHKRPDLAAGQHVALEKLGSRLSGTYLVTQVTHLFNRDGYVSTFSVRGARSGLLGEQVNGSRPQRRWPGLVTAVVTNTDDPNDWGRVKVKYPWMTEDAESNWARVVGVGAGPEAGLFATPDVNDEVAVAFEHGDFNRPFVLGGLWNGQSAAPPPGTGAAAGEKPLVRAWQSRTGHWMAMYDNADNKLEIITAGGHLIVMDDANKKLEIHTTGGQKVTLDDNSRKVSIESGGDVEVKSTGNMKLEATANMEIKANGNLDIKANGMMNIQTSAILNVKGSLINLN